MRHVALTGHGYIGRCRFRLRRNSTNCQPSKVTKRKMTEEELIKYGVIVEDSEDKTEKNK